jgi:vitamin K-dependent gamma-carboxylase
MKNSPLRHLSAWLVMPVDNTTLAAFRILFGTLICVELVGSWSRRVEMISSRPIRFPYTGFEWVPLLPGWLAPAVYATIILAAVTVALGYCYRVTAVLFAVGYTYSFLVDRAYFNNHFYLICLLAGWLAVGDAHRRWSIDAWRHPSLVSRTVPRWQLFGPAIQMAIPYVFGGLAKIKADWLRGEPMRAQLWELWDNPFYGPLVQQPWAGVAFAWAGMLFDLLIVPAMLWRPTRWPAIAAMLLFHLTNMQMFDIGIFPWLGMGGVVLFLPPAMLDSWLTRDRGTGGQDAVKAATGLPTTGCSPWVAWGCAAWLATQLLLPFRHHLIPGNVGWTREGFYFAWTMKLDLKSEFLGFHLCDPASGECQAANLDGTLTGVQRYWLPGEPQGIVAFARFLKERAIRDGMPEPVVVCDSVCAMNGRPYQYMLDPARDPADLVVPRFGPADWIVPLDEAAPLGNYKIGAKKERAVMQVIHETRVVKKIFPERLRGRPVVDAPDAREARPPP